MLPVLRVGSAGIGSVLRGSAGVGSVLSSSVWIGSRTGTINGFVGVRRRVAIGGLAGTRRIVRPRSRHVLALLPGVGGVGGASGAGLHIIIIVDAIGVGATREHADAESEGQGKDGS